MKTIMTAVLALAISNATYAAEPAKKTKPAPAAAKNETLKVDPAASTVTWTGTKKLMGQHTGTIAVKEGEVVVNAAGEPVSGKVVIDMSTIKNEDLKGSPEDQKKLEVHLSSADFFNVAKYPTATFTFSKISKEADGTYAVKGKLDMIGKSKPLDFKATIVPGKESLTGEAKISVDRTKWGLKYNSGNYFKDLAADKVINNDFTLDVKLSAKK